MPGSGSAQRTRSDIRNEREAFLLDRQARGLAARTVTFYREKLDAFVGYVEAHGVQAVRDVTPAILRAFLLELAKTHNPGGCHASYRAVRAFLTWWEAEAEPKDWANPLHKVKAPKVPLELLEPLSMDTLKAMLKACPQRTLTGDRDRAILMALLDTGCRAAEFVALNLGDVNMDDGAVWVRHGKGGKGRAVFLGTRTRKTLLVYLRHRPTAQAEDPLWATEQGTRLTYAGLRSMVQRRADLAGVAAPPLHSFRRAFALVALRAGLDLVSLQRLLGHAGLAVVGRYLKQVQDDLQEAHSKAGPVDNIFKKGR